MLKKLFTLFVTLILSVGLWANSITYTATEAWDYKANAFDLPIQAHTFVEAIQKGTITFDGDVTEIRDSAFHECGILTSMTLPNTITKIGNYAFDYCTNLTSITLSNTLTTIGERAFACTDLTSITIPNSVTTLGDFALYGNYNLTTITIPNSVTTIGGYVFSACINLTSINIEGSACQNGIHDAAFWNVGKDKSVTVILPADWETDNLPMNSQTRWHGGYLTSERTFDQYKQAALKNIDDALGDDAEGDIFQDFITYYKTAINGADKCKFIDGVKKASIAMIPIIKSTYTTGEAAGDTVGYERAKTELLGSMITPQNGPAVVVTDQDDKQIILYSPKKVQYIKASDK